MSSTPQGEVRTPVSRLASTAGLSSDYISPTTRRRPIPLTSQSSILSNFAENDDAAEKRQRRHSRVMEMQRHLQSPVSSPSDSPTERKRRSLPLSGLSTGQLTDHYSNCIKLSAENKINSKNAFGLHLIDYMAELLKSKKGEMTNFQVASCTLDASAKIYAGRVDAIHAETYKMLGGLGHDRQNKHSEGDADAEGPDANDGKKKKRARHSNTVETNLKNINVTKLDLGFEPDPLFQRTSAAFDEGGSFGLLLNHLQCRDDGCELLLDSNTIINNEEEPSKSEKGIQTMVDMSEITGNARLKINTSAERLLIEVTVPSSRRLKAEAEDILCNSELGSTQMARLSELNFLREQNELEIGRTKQLADIEVGKFAEMVKALGAETIMEMANAGPKLQVELLSSLGLETTVFTDGNSPVNLFNVAQGLIAQPAQSKSA
nr:condensin complex subunit 2-like [Lytechinus pictus]